jgi:hypothetical protein
VALFGFIKLELLVANNVKALMEKKDANKNTSEGQDKHIQSLSIFRTSFFTTTPLAINCSNIICHSLSSIPVEGE